MPPRARITREMIVGAGFEVAREQGIESVNARTVSERLGCSTQPVMYHFRRIEELRQAVYQRADEYHTGYITDGGDGPPMLSIGLAYIRFAQEEKHLFRLLFQSDGFAGKSVAELIEAEALAPVIGALSGAAGVDGARARAIFTSLFLLVHGYASMFANNSLDYDEAAIAADLKRAFVGAVYAAKEETL